MPPVTSLPASSSSASIASNNKMQQQQDVAKPTTTPESNNNNIGSCSKAAATNGFSPCSSSSSIVSASHSLLGNGSGCRSRSDASNSSGDDGQTSETQRSAWRLANADYDVMRNKTVMFFLDRLYNDSIEGKEVRTLHDLSCLFGTKEFTKEMRQIVGGSRNGLRKLLEAYPSLFTVDADDKVYLSQYYKGEHGRGANQARDYNQEAVEYFSKKLLQFGQSLVPIRYLFGYRSQASQEVRHVSGRSGKEFKEFLSENSHVFDIVGDDNVILKSVSSGQEDVGKLIDGPSTCCDPDRNMSHQESPISLDVNLNHQQQHQLNRSNQAMDPYLNRLVALAIQATLRKQLDSKPEQHVSVSSLHKLMLAEAENSRDDVDKSLYIKLITSVDDLRMMLRMHPKLFKRYTRTATSNNSSHNSDEKPEQEQQDNQKSEFVRLLSDTELADKLAASSPQTRQPKQQPDELNQQPESLGTSDSLSCQQPMSLPAQLVASPSDTTSRPYNAQAKPKSSLRADASTFIPASLRLQQQQQQLQQQQSVGGKLSKRANKRSQLLEASQDGSELASETKSIIAADTRQSLRSYIIKATVANSSAGLYNPSKLSNGAQLAGSKDGLQFVPEEDAKARTVSIVREASSIVGRIMSTGEPVAFDCKGYNLGLNGQITLIQLGFMPANCDDQVAGGDLKATNRKPEVCLFDLITNPELAYVVKPLLECEKNVKIIHEVRNKSNALYVQFGIVLKNVFDTQVANLVIQQQETGRPAYKSRYRSISKLCEIYGDQSLNKYRALIKTKTRHGGAGYSGDNIGPKAAKDVNYWHIRPLTDAMVWESTMDVYCLIGGVYQELKTQIRKEYEPLFEQLNLECVMARIKPEEIRSVKKERKIELEVIDLKRKLYSLPGPIVLSNREIRLLRHIDLSEEVRAKIQHCKKVEKKIERLDMKAAKQDQQADNTDGSMVDPNAIMSLGSTAHSDFDSTSGHKSTILIDQDFDPETDLPNLINGSMFDEIKTRMNETSTLLKSLDEEYNDDDEFGANKLMTSGQTDLGSTSYQTDQDDSCSCHCHKSSLGSRDGNRSGLSSLVSTQGSQTEPQLQQELDEQLNIESSSKPTASQPEEEDMSTAKVDMAVQCDLLS